MEEIYILKKQKNIRGKSYTWWTVEYTYGKVYTNCSISIARNLWSLLIHRSIHKQHVIYSRTPKHLFYLYVLSFYAIGLLHLQIFLHVHNEKLTSICKGAQIGDYLQIACILKYTHSGVYMLTSLLTGRSYQIDLVNILDRLSSVSALLLSSHKRFICFLYKKVSLENLNKVGDIGIL